MCLCGGVGELCMCLYGGVGELRMCFCIVAFMPFTPHFFEIVAEVKMLVLPHVT